GRVYQVKGKYDEALTELQAYKSKATPKESEEQDVDVYIDQCNTAKTMIAAPLDVKIENMGVTHRGCRCSIRFYCQRLIGLLKPAGEIGLLRLARRERSKPRPGQGPCAIP
ncbi:MAG: hypothetical protein ACKOAV_11020, partial [Bacteroidota bacterium]